MPDWIIWALGVIGLIAAGVIAATRHRAGARRDHLAAETTRARRALSLAEAARDSCPQVVAQAQLEFDQATALLSGARDPDSALRARELAERAEGRWLAASYGSSGDAA